MSYLNPNIPTIENATGLLAAIQHIQVALGALPWLSKSFGRAYLMPEKNTAKGSNTVPKVYAGAKEYYCVLPNDNLPAYSFMQVLGPETITDYDFVRPQNELTVSLAIVVFVNLKKLDPNTDHIFTDRLKNDVVKVLKREATAFTLEQIQDEKIRDIFEGYQSKDQDPALLMYPHAAMRFTGTLTYSEPCS